MALNPIILIALFGVGAALGDVTSDNAYTPVIPDYSKIPHEFLKADNNELLSTATCYEPAWDTCRKSFYAQMGLIGPFQSAAAFVNAVTGVYKSLGQNGFIKVCNAQRFLYTCMGPTQFAACTNALHWLRQGASPADAFAYQAWYKQNHFQCGGGYMTFLYNWPCIGQTNIFKNATLQGCIQHYQSNIVQHTAQACQLDMVLSNCFKTVFNKCSNKVGWTLCEAVRIATDATFPQCNNRCIVGSSSIDEEQTGEHMGEHMGIMEADKPTQ